MKKELFPNFKGFSYRSLVFDGENQGVTRRDPSPVIKYNNHFYVWYSRTTVACHGYTATIWYATSKDGVHWLEKDQALARGGAGEFDEHAVFTPSIFKFDDQYYLSYTGVPEPFYNGEHLGHNLITPTAFGLATASTPDGPWRKLADNPVFRPSNNHSFFDSLRVDDSCFVIRKNKIFMYYKGRQVGCTPKETKMGLAVALNPQGPYERVGDQALIKGGHEVCCWPHGEGVASLVSGVGEEGASLRYSRDGINFEKIVDTTPPQAPGLFRADDFVETTEAPGVSWGICHVAKANKIPFLQRFDTDLLCQEKQ